MVKKNFHKENIKSRWFYLSSSTKLSRNKLCWETLLCGSLGFCMSYKQALTALFHTVFSRMFSIANSLVRQREYLSSEPRGVLNTALKIQIVSPTKAEGRHAYCPLQSLNFLSSGILSCNTIHYVCKCYPVLFTSPCRNWGSGNRCKNADYLGIAVHKKLPFISDSGNLCLLPESINYGRLTFTLQEE